MNIGIVGLGLIGASLAKSIKKNTGHTVYGFNRTKSVEDYALLSSIIDFKLDENTIGLCDYIFVSLYPKASIDYIRDQAKYIKKSAVVIDCCGIKSEICKVCQEISSEYGFTFIGGHPMAGTQYSGIKYAKDNMFKNACFVLVPKENEEISVLSNTRNLIIEIGFARINIMSPEKHDRLIAFTSQLAHVVSNAYIKSPSAQEHKGISAGSYKDLTRVAWLNENMWAELFMENKDNLLFELNYIINSLNEYKTALESDDKETLTRLLKEGREAKEKAEKI